jgi:predicted Zn-dependent protease
MTSAAWATERALELCTEADGCVAVADESVTLHLRWAANGMTTNGATVDRRLTVAATAGAGIGVASAHGSWDEDGVAALVEAATATAREATPAPDAQPLVGPGDDNGVGWGEPAATASFADLGDLVTGLGEAFETAREHGRLLHGYAEHRLSTSHLASSAGVRLRHVQPTGVFDLTAANADRSVSTWAGSHTPTGTDPVALADRLGSRLAWSERPAATLPPGDYQVLLPPSGTADLMLHMYESLAARDALAGQSVFSAAEGVTKVGERLTDAPLTLRSDPAEPGLECAPFVLTRASGAASSVFDNGLPLTATDWIRQGELNALHQTRASARAGGLPCTPPIDNLVLAGPDGGRSLAEMVAATRRGLLLTSLWYLREVNPRTLLLTGVTRDGVFLVEDGEITATVPDFRFNESPVSLLGRVAEVGRTEPTLPREWGDYFTRMAMPTLRIDGFAVSAPAGP